MAERESIPTLPHPRWFVTAELSKRDEFLASHPEAEQLQEAQISEISQRIDAWLPAFRETIKRFIQGAENARQIGILIHELSDSLPGKRITPDFWRQIKKKFIGREKLDLPMIEWLLRIARSSPDPIDSAEKALQYRQPLLLAAGEIEEEGRGEQHRRMPGNALAEIKEFFCDAAEVVKAFRSDPRLCPGGKIREDLKPLLRLDLEPKKRAIDEFWSELE